MRSTIVPAQITTVEDKIAGNLGLSQLILLTLPVFGGSVLFVVLPPFFTYATYKVVLIVCFAALCAVLAIRIKGRILLFWGVAILRYNVRPRYYVFNKNSEHLRSISPVAQQEEISEEAQPKKLYRSLLPQLSTPDLVKIEDIIANPKANLHFRTNRKGELSVHITEVQ